MEHEQAPAASSPNLDALDTLGMTESELYAYLEEMLQEEAIEAAEAEGTSPAEELASPGFMSARAASTYAIKLILANNAYLARHLMDLGALPGSNADLGKG